MSLDSVINVRETLVSKSAVGAEGISGGPMKRVEIERNTNDESTMFGRH